MSPKEVTEPGRLALFLKNRQMECIAAALKSLDKSGYSLQRTYALGLGVQGRFD